jgi:hypothetical protein
LRRHRRQQQHHCHDWLAHHHQQGAAHRPSRRGCRPSRAPMPTCTHVAFTATDAFVAARVYRQRPVRRPMGSPGRLPAPPLSGGWCGTCSGAAFCRALSGPGACRGLESRCRGLVLGFANLNPDSRPVAHMWQRPTALAGILLAHTDEGFPLGCGGAGACFVSCGVVALLRHACLTSVLVAFVVVLVVRLLV